MRTTPMPSSQASVSTMKVSAKFGKANTGVVIIALFRLLKACSA
uniref:Uncharacterized protein n=1 Tax=Arundo donax TaxID=35708 RepID=A0A0A9C728_ARUDO